MNNKIRNVQRRRSRSLVGFASEDLCQTIPNSLLPSERLLMLLEKSFQYSLSVVQKEVSSTEGFDISTFRQKGTECWEKIKTILEEKNLIQSAVAENIRQNESVTCSSMEEFNEQISRFQAEHDKWKDLMSDYRESLKKEIDSPYEINASECEGQLQLYDYSDLKQSISSTEEKLSKDINKLSSSMNSIERCVQLSDTFYKAAVKKYEKYLKQNQPDTPRTVIKRMVSSRKCLKPYSRPV